MEKMLCMLKDLQNIKRAADQKLQETEDEALALNRKVETLEQVIKEMYSSLLFHEKQCGNDDITSPNITTVSSQTAKLTDDFKNEIDKLQENIVLVSTRSRSWMTIRVCSTFSSIMSEFVFSFL